MMSAWRKTISSTDPPMSVGQVCLCDIVLTLPIQVVSLYIDVKVSGLESYIDPCNYCKLNWSLLHVLQLVWLAIY